MSPLFLRHFFCLCKTTFDKDKSCALSSNKMTTYNPPISLPLLEFVHLMNPKTNQSMPNSLCARIENRLADCYEAYGYGRKGKKKCADLFYDFHECQTSTFQFMRFEAIRKQRMKLYREGKLKKPFDEHPPIDGLLYYGA